MPSSVNISTDCRDYNGITIGLIDGVIAMCRIIAKRDLEHPDVVQAFIDLAYDEDVNAVIRHASMLKDSQD